MTQLSYSRLRMYLQCPRQYRLRVDHTPASTLPEIMVRGKYAHKFFELYVQHCMMTNSYQDLDNARTLMAETYRTQTMESAAIGEPVLAPDAWNEVMRDLLWPWTERTIVPLESSPRCELRVSRDRDLHPAPWENGWFRAVLDRVELFPDHLLVTDYKTGFAGKADPFQAAVYAWLMMSEPFVQEVRVVFEHVARDRSECLTFARDQWQELDEVIRTLCETVEADTECAARPGAACAECPYAHACDAKAVVRTVLETEDEARKAVETLALLERDVDAVKDALRCWVDGHGPLHHAGLVYEYRTSTGEGFHDAVAFMNAMNALGKDWDGCVSVNNVRAKKYQKLLPDLVTEKPSIRFGGFKSSE